MYNLCDRYIRTIPPLHTTYIVVYVQPIPLYIKTILHLHTNYATVINNSSSGYIVYCIEVQEKLYAV